jgi:hypothetical protein
MNSLSGGSRAAAGCLLAGGLASMVGATLPWITLLGGLHPLRGVIGMNGKLLFAAGALSAVLGVVALAKPLSNAVLSASGFGGAAMTVATAWFITGAQSIQGEFARNPMTLAQMGTGLFVAAAGGIIVSLTLLLSTPRPSPLEVLLTNP